MNAADLDHALQQAAAAIRQADALLIAAGAGMGVDSGLPDFRGNEGFWKAYPPFRQRGLSFVDLANPVRFLTDPRQAWGFYGHRFQLYRAAQPHAGFALLRAWALVKSGGYFVFTSNVDGHFQQAGFEPQRIVECHGSIRHLQCAAPCGDAIWSAEGLTVAVDPSDFRARPPLPQCPHCGGTARPNILMFGDDRWLSDRADRQWQQYQAWSDSLRGARLTIVECGAGLAVPTVRQHCQRQPGTLIRINLRDPQVPAGGIALPLGAAEALARIAALLDP